MAKSLEEQLINACRIGDLSFVKDLVSQGADIHVNDDDALRWAAQNGHLGVVKFLVKHGANIHAKNDWSLRWGAFYDYLDVVKYLEGIILVEKRKKVWQKV